MKSTWLAAAAVAMAVAVAGVSGPAWADGGRHIRDSRSEARVQRHIVEARLAGLPGARGLETVVSTPYLPPSDRIEHDMALDAQIHRLGALIRAANGPAD